MQTIESISEIATAADFGDGRLDKRLGVILKGLSEQANDSIPQIFKNRSQMKAAYNFLGNEKVTSDKILQAQLEGQFSSQLLSNNIVLALHDTTELDFTGKRSQDQIGCLNYQFQKGLYLHNTLMVSAEGIPLSVFAQHFWSREESSLHKKKERKFLPIEEKESYRWIKGFENVQDYFREHPQKTVINVCDREGDIHELLQAKQTPNCHYIIRSCNNRKVNESEKKLWQHLDGSPVVGEYELAVTDQITKKSRIATIEVRYQSAMELQPSYRKDGHKLRCVEINIVQAKEINPPDGVKAIDWKLLTTMEVENFEQAFTIINYYSHRWRIESFHYVLKVGCGVEKLQLEQEHNLKNAITLYSLIACRILSLMYYSREEKQIEITQAGFTEQDYNALSQYLEHVHHIKTVNKKNKMPTLREFVKMIGILGGFKDWKKQPHPGAKALWCGLREFQIITYCFSLFANKTYG